MTLHDHVLANDAAGVLNGLRAGADPDMRGPDGFTPLISASGIGHYHVAELLLTAGADVHALEPRMGATALHKAAQAGNLDMIALLLDHGAFIDQQTPTLGNTPLIDAVLHKHEMAVSLLLRRGARMNVPNHVDQTALDIARADGLRDVARRLEAEGRAQEERVSTFTLVAAAKRGDQEAVAQMIAAGERIDQRLPIIGSADDNYTPLGIAAREGHVEIVRLLLDAGADRRGVIGLMGGFPLHDATYFGHVEVVRLLTAAAPVPGLDVQGAYNGLSAIHDAVWHGHIEVARVLIDAGARLDLRSHTGATPRELALRYGYLEIADLLARAEAARSKAPGPIGQTGAGEHDS